MNHGQPVFQGKDVPKGVDKFYSYFQGEEKGIVTGSGRAIIHDIELESNGEKGIQEINYLDELILHIHATIDPDIKYPSVGVTILGQELQNIVQSNSAYHGVEICNSGEEKDRIFS